MENECLEFKKLEELYAVNCEQALDIGFLQVMGSDPFVSHEDSP